jgi:hypothetical protein
LQALLIKVRGSPVTITVPGLLLPAKCCWLVPSMLKPLTCLLLLLAIFAVGSLVG